MSNASKYIALAALLAPLAFGGFMAYQNNARVIETQNIVVQPPMGRVDMGPVVYTEYMCGSGTIPEVTIQASTPRRATPGLVRKDGSSAVAAPFSSYKEACAYRDALKDTTIYYAIVERI